MTTTEIRCYRHTQCGKPVYPIACNDVRAASYRAWRGETDTPVEGESPLFALTVGGATPPSSFPVCLFREGGGGGGGVTPPEPFPPSLSLCPAAPFECPYIRRNILTMCSGRPPPLSQKAKSCGTTHRGAELALSFGRKLHIQLGSWDLAQNAGTWLFFRILKCLELPVSCISITNGQIEYQCAPKSKTVEHPLSHLA